LTPATRRAATHCATLRLDGPRRWSFSRHVQGASAPERDARWVGHSVGRLSSAALAALVLFTAVGTSACVDDRPLVVAGRDGGVDAGPQPAPPTDLGAIDSPGCQRCDQVIANGVYASRVCVADRKPSSAERLAGYFDCACRTECIVPCSLHCAGSAPDSACSACINSQCDKAQQACLEAKP
jgi:hypothetical protein